jgi:hypothetical protein
LAWKATGESQPEERYFTTGREISWNLPAHFSGRNTNYEAKIPYVGGLTAKKVDFAILHKEKLRIGVEVNFFTIHGSKPSEIKRAYENVSRNLSGVHVDFVWITDGIGYLKMQRSLTEAFESHLNIYNYNTAQRYLYAEFGVMKVLDLRDGMLETGKLEKCAGAHFELFPR